MTHKKLCICGHVAVATTAKRAAEAIQAHCIYRKTLDADSKCHMFKDKNS